MEKWWHLSKIFIFDRIEKTANDFGPFYDATEGFINKQLRREYLGLKIIPMKLFQGMKLIYFVLFYFIG